MQSIDGFGAKVVIADSVYDSREIFNNLASLISNIYKFPNPINTLL
jgi:predicted AlkP superfamily pyrophosphatase or phosphodiesterase